MHRNFLYRTDSYKVGHWPQYPPGTTEVSSYLESRGGMFDETTFFGNQYYLEEYFQGEVFTKQDIDEAFDFCMEHFGNPRIFNVAGWQRLLEKHGGRLRLEIKALPEGTVCSTRNALMTVRNTDPEFPWLTNWAESLLLKVWYPTTVATLSREIKKVILKALVETGDPSLIPFKLHDFGYRGVSSEESSEIGGAAHLINFMGSDTLMSINMARQIYGAKMAGYSVAATEHSTMTSWTKDKEVDAVRNDLLQYPSGILSIVGDSYDIFNFCENILGRTLRQEVLQRDGKVVVRPDSGNPRDVVLKVLEILGERFSYTVNSKGYKVLLPKVGVIQGDGMNYYSIVDLYAHLKNNGWSADNLVVGMGGGLLQQVNRDTMKFAFKCSNITVNGLDREVYKDPITDPGKVSKRGRLAVVPTNHGDFRTVQVKSGLGVPFDALETVFLNGKITKRYTFDQIRARAEYSLSEAATG